MKNSTHIASAIRVVIASLLMLIPIVALAQTEERALKMVQVLRLGDNLSDMTYQFAKNTTTYKIVEKTLGPQKADELLRAEIAVAVPKHQDEWNHTLAQAWAPLMTAEEFDSVVSEKQKSPFAPKFMSLQGQAGATMKVSAEPLLKTVLMEVLTGIFEKSMPKK
ncbi:hypothetical protein [Rhodoferax saidenbachensis]|uniref:DUF2059 domain-containing protein n=1 Tax=Rhodoferax saidenbachensis TaxID=1484693 RepID=A0ABU1ZJG6_9BURK|nr:hypothetical protein [Rhodoferax saidenbachensis]MDR7305683.1 hypothetical protein [Rhodoferax saidenbachensis]